MTRFNVINNTTDLLSDSSLPKQNFNELVKDFGSDSRFIVLIQSPDTARNRLAADAVGPYLETLKPNVSTVLYKIDYTAIKQRLLFTRDPAELKKIADQVEKEVAMQQASAKNTQQIALDLNSILDEANQKFDDKYLRQSTSWVDFNQFVPRFISILNKISAQASGKATSHSEDPIPDG